MVVAITVGGGVNIALGGLVDPRFAGSNLAEDSGF
jgi:hypothetical protein